MTTTTLIVGQSPGLAGYLSPLGLWRSLWSMRGLAGRLVRRDLEMRYRGSALGLLWAFVTPIALLALYTFVFGVVFQSRWPQTRSEGLDSFALSLFCGFIPFNLLSECAVRSPTAILAVPAYVKRVVFPLELLPLTLVGSALVNAFVSLGLLIGVSWWTVGHVPWTLILAPLALLPLLCLSLSLAWFLASVGVFVRDLNQGITLVMQVILFATPIFYPRESLPAQFRTVVALNPLTWVVENLRRSVLWGEPLEWQGFALWSLLAGSGMLLAYAWFMKTKRAFADVL
jgi:lipopolysaccharide transport system permease protein